MSETIVYTDGSCLGNPGKGGWAAVIIKNNQEEIIFGSEKNSTNNRMELTAAINALLKTKESEKIKIYTDSKYLKDGIEKWINNWKNNNWKNANKKDVKNKDLWTKLDSLINKKQISWEWVKAHSINEYNNKVDILARKAASAND
ncbi:MAG: ribonuclease HI [Candidatus Fonsibacter ubiquis]|jgi:ribonuclease HI|nr:ribonuclease HI [Candidatus Fonsibacter ubiquis]